jgi:hypothetical protein
MSITLSKQERYDLVGGSLLGLFICQLSIVIAVPLQQWFPYSCTDLGIWEGVVEVQGFFFAQAAICGTLLIRQSIRILSFAGTSHIYLSEGVRVDCFKIQPAEYVTVMKHPSMVPFI